VTALLVSEVRRALARRLVRVLALLALAGVVAITVGNFVNSTKAAAGNGLDVEAERQARVQACRQSSPPGFQASCDRLTPLASPPGDKRFKLVDLWLGRTERLKRGITRTRGYVLASTSTLFFLLALVVGASFIGAEYRAGTLTTLLTWEPRRARVLAAKLAAAALAGAGLYLLLQLLLTALLWGVASTRGITAGADAAFYRGIAGLLARGTALASGLAVLGACLAFLGRTTSAALGGVLVYLIGVEGILNNQAPDWSRWFLLPNTVAVFTGEQLRRGGFTRSPGGAAALTVAYLAALVGVTVVVLRRRDVT